VPGAWVITAGPTLWPFSPMASLPGAAAPVRARASKDFPGSCKPVTHRMLGWGTNVSPAGCYLPVDPELDAARRHPERARRFAEPGRGSTRATRLCPRGNTPARGSVPGLGSSRAWGQRDNRSHSTRYAPRAVQRPPIRSGAHSVGLRRQNVPDRARRPKRTSQRAELEPHPHGPPTKCDLARGLAPGDFPPIRRGRPRSRGAPAPPLP
jgi:hypothetical protein